MENNVRLWILCLGFSLPFLFLLTPFSPLRNFKLARKIIQDFQTAVKILVFLNLLENQVRKRKVEEIVKHENPTLINSDLLLLRSFIITVFSLLVCI